MNAVHLPPDEDIAWYETEIAFMQALAALAPYPIAPVPGGTRMRTERGIVSMELWVPAGAVRRVDADIDVWDWADRSSILLALSRASFPRSSERPDASARSLRVGEGLLQLDLQDEVAEGRYYAFAKGVLSDQVGVLAIVGGATASRRDELLAALVTLAPAPSPVTESQP